jgi:hypothetical protein
MALLIIESLESIESRSSWCPESEICEQIQGLRRHPEHDRARGPAGFGTPWGKWTQVPASPAFHGATRPHPASALGTRAAAPEQGWPVLDGARRPQGCRRRPPNY